MKALLTGAEGFVGQYLLRLLIEKHYDIIATYLSKQPNINNSYIKWEQVDICNRDSVSRLFQDNHLDEVYHLAALAMSTGNDDDQYYQVNCGGTINLLKAIQIHAPSVRVLYVCSSNIYGAVPPESIPIVETQPLKPNSYYAASKAAAEVAIYPYVANGMQVVIARPFNHTGAGQTTDYVCSRIAKQMASISAGIQEPIIEVGNIDVARDFTDVRDVARAYQLLIQKGIPGEAYNVCSEHAYYIRDVIKCMENIIGIKVTTDSRTDLVRKGDVRLLMGSRTKIYDATGWEPEITFEQTLKSLIDYWRKFFSEKSPQEFVTLKGL